jgi:uncharacterized membrane protein
MKLEGIVARQLSIGTAVACILMTLGLALPNERAVVAGITCLVALPVLRVAILVIAFARQLDGRFVALGLAVLAIIGFGAALLGG